MPAILLGLEGYRPETIDDQMRWSGGLQPMRRRRARSGSAAHRPIALTEADIDAAPAHQLGRSTRTRMR